jgi:hypothetical protein
MHFSLCACHFVYERLFIDEVLLVQRVPTRLGDRAQPILVPFFHDGGRVSVLVMCGDGYVAPQGHARSAASRCDLVGNATRAYYVHPWVGRGSEEGDGLDAEAWSQHLCLCLPLFQRLARGALRRNEGCPRWCGMHSRWRGWARKRTVYAVMSSHRVSTHVTDDHARRPVSPGHFVPPTTAFFREVFPVLYHTGEDCAEEARACSVVFGVQTCIELGAEVEIEPLADEGPSAVLGGLFLCPCLQVMVGFRVGVAILCCMYWETARGKKANGVVIGPGVGKKTTLPAMERRDTDCLMSSRNSPDSYYHRIFRDHECLIRYYVHARCDRKLNSL